MVSSEEAVTLLQQFIAALTERMQSIGADHQQELDRRSAAADAAAAQLRRQNEVLDASRQTVSAQLRDSREQVTGVQRENNQLRKTLLEQQTSQDDAAARALEARTKAGNQANESAIKLHVIGIVQPAWSAWR